MPAWGVCLLIIVVTLAVYWSATGYGFVDYDDGDYVTGNSHVQAGLTWAGVKWAFTTGHASNWHPLTWLSHMLDVSLFGRTAGGHHFTSLLWHAVNTWLVFVVLNTLTGARWRSVCVAGLFALHPLHVESVAWISERKDVLSTAFGLLTLGAYGKYVRGARGQVSGGEGGRFTFHASRWYLLALLAFACGLMCKPMLVTLPLVMLLLDFWPLARWNKTAAGSWPRLVGEKFPFLALCVTSSVVTFLVQQKGGAVSPLAGLPVTARVANAFVSYARYLGKTFWPDNLSVLYPHPGYWPVWQVVGAVVLVLLLSVGVVLLRRRAPYLAVGWFWFAGMLVPVIGLVQVGIQSMADRYTYLPAVGLFTALVWGAGALAQRRPASRPIFASMAGLVILACGVATAFQVRIWRNTETLFRNAVRVTKDNYLAYNNLGFYCSNQGRLPEALEYFRASLAINPNYADANNNLGHALAKQRKFAEAVGYYRIALRSSPGNVEVHNNLGNALAELGDPAGAIAEYQFVLQRQPDHADAHNNLGIALAMQGQVPEAVRHFTEALRLNPDHASAHGNLGNAFAVQRQWTQAIEQYQQALALTPDDAQTRNNLGNVLTELGRFDEAVTNYTRALQLNAENPEARFNLANALLRLGRREEAAQNLREAVRLRPDYEAARQQLNRLNAE